MKKIIVNVVLDFLVGGALVGCQRIAKALPQYTWHFSTEVMPGADILLYMNNNRHYVKAKELKIPHIIQRKTGERSLAIQTPDDLSAVICASKRSYETTSHKRKILIYNGIDLEYLKTIKPKTNVQWLIAESRHGIGQKTEISIQHAIKNHKHLTILGSGKGLAENTYDKLVKKYPQYRWVGRVSAEEALQFIAGCEAILIANPAHGVAQQIIEAQALNKRIIDLCPTRTLEIPNYAETDIKVCAAKYQALIESILNE